MAGNMFFFYFEMISLRKTKLRGFSSDLLCAQLLLFSFSIIHHELIKFGCKQMKPPSTQTKYILHRISKNVDSTIGNNIFHGNIKHIISQNMTILLKSKLN